MSIITDKLTFSYRTGRKINEVLRDVSFLAEAGELTALLGANGAGKSTILKCILGLLKGYGGSIKVGLAGAEEFREASQLSAGQLARRIAYIPQLHYQSFAYTVLDMVLMGTTNQLSGPASPGEPQRAAAAEALDKFGILHLADNDFTTLSGGEQQLVLMARAYAQKAPIWLLDEPVAGLDYGNQIKTQEKLREMAHRGYTILMTTHNPEQTFMFADKVVAIKDGSVIACGKPEEIMDNRLISALYGIETTVHSLENDRVRVFLPKSGK